MNLSCNVLLSICVTSLLMACSSAPLVKQPPEWAYEKDAIQLHITSDPQLNLYQKRAHSLLVCLYHLRDLNGFNQFSDDKDGLPKLLECSRFDSSVTYSKKLIIQPGQNVTELLDRTDGAKYMGIVAGYYSLQKEGTVRTYAIPVSEVRKGSVLVQKSEKLNVDLNFAPHEIKQHLKTPEEIKNSEGKETK